MTVQIGSMFASLTLDTQQFIRGMGQADKLTGTTMESIRRKGDGAAKSLDGLVRVFGSTGIASGSRAFQEVNRSVATLPGTLRAATTALAGFGGLFGTAALGKSLDTFTGLQNQLRSVGEGFGSTGAQFETLLGVAQRSRTDIDAVVTLFTRLAKAQPGAAFEKTARSVETVTKALQLGGATAEEAASAAIQFSQAIQSGRLGGDELRAVLESPLGNALAKGLGITVGKMRELSTQGKLTSDVVLGALEKVGPEIDAKFSKSVETIGQSFTLLQNQIVATVGKLDESFGASRIITSGISAVADNLDLVTKAAAAAALAIGSISVGKIGGGGVAALGASFRSLGAEAQAGVSAATQQLSVLEDALKRALAERAKLNTIIGPRSTEGTDKLSQGLALSNRRIAEITSILPQARAELGAAQKAASGFGLAMGGLRSVGGSLVSFLGGPWGAAFAVAATGVSLLAAKYAEAAQQAQNFKEVSSRLLDSVANTNSDAGDLVKTEKYSKDLEALRSDAAIVRKELTRVLNPLNAIGAEIDELRQTSGEFQLFPGAVRTTEFLREQIDKLVKGGSLREFNTALDLFQQKNALPPATIPLFDEIRDQAAQATRSLEALRVAESKIKDKLAAPPKLEGFQGRDQAIQDGLARLKDIADARKAVTSSIFDERMANIIGPSQKLVDKIADALRANGKTVNDAVIAFIRAQVRSLQELDKIKSADERPPVEPPPRPQGNIRIPGQRGGPEQKFTYDPYEAARRAQTLKDMDDLQNKIRENNKTLEETDRIIQQGITPDIVEKLFGKSADYEKIKGLIASLNEDFRGISERFARGGASAQEVLDQLEGFKTIMKQYGGDPEIVDSLVESLRQALGAQQKLNAEIDAQKQKLEELKRQYETFRTPGGAKGIIVPQDAPQKSPDRNPFANPPARPTFPAPPPSQPFSAPPNDKGAAIRQQIEGIKADVDQLVGKAQSVPQDLLPRRVFGDPIQWKSALEGAKAKIDDIMRGIADGSINGDNLAEAVKQITQGLAEAGANSDALVPFNDTLLQILTNIQEAIARLQQLNIELDAVKGKKQNTDFSTSGASSSNNKLLQFATGGAFKVGGSGGTDSQLVQFMASPTETVAVFTPSQVEALKVANDNSGGGGNIHVPITIVANDAASFKNSKRQVQMDIADAVQAAVNRTR